MTRKAVVVFGSRTLSGDRVKKIILDEFIANGGTEIITTGETHGVCETARLLAKEKSIPLKTHFLNKTRYAAGCFEHRSKEILQDGDFLVIIHDGKSKGTANELALAKKMKIPYSYHKLQPIVIDESIPELTTIDLAEVTT